MGLESYVTRTSFVPFSGEEGSNGITVRALNLDDVTFLVGNHLGAIAEVVELYEKNRETIFRQANLDQFVITALRAAPGLAAEMIAVACDQPELHETAGKLAFGIQMRALQDILRLSLEEGGGVKNWFAALVNAGQEAMPRVRAMMAARNIES